MIITAKKMIKKGSSELKKKEINSYFHLITFFLLFQVCVHISDDHVTVGVPLTRFMLFVYFLNIFYRSVSVVETIYLKHKNIIYGSCFLNLTSILL